MSSKNNHLANLPKLATLLIISLLLSGCANVGSWGAKPENSLLGAGLQGYNHTQFEISGFSINGVTAVLAEPSVVMIPKNGALI